MPRWSRAHDCCGFRSTWNHRHYFKKLSERYNIAGSSAIVAMAEPLDLASIDLLRFATGRNIEVVVGSEMEIERAIMLYYPRDN